ncbi:hypothetical protein KAR48_05485 [bacterium]|nr:hypothetical protein [bacterium]
MAFKREYEKKGISLPGLIDIVFLLLIFSLVTLSVSQSVIDQPGQDQEDTAFPLPEIESQTAKRLEQELTTILFQIEHNNAEDFSSPLIIYTLLPDEDLEQTVDGALKIAMADSLLHATFPQNFLDLSDRQFRNLRACRLIRKSIRQYKEDNFFEPNPMNSIEIRAVRDTEFKIINYILQFTSTFKDTIPRFMVRTINGKEVVVGV